MAKIQDRQAQAMQYLQLLQSGVPSAEAFKQAYPNGIPTQQQQLEQQSRDSQNGALLGTGGTIAGLLAAKYGTDYISSLGGDAAAKLAAEEAAKAAAAKAAAAGAPATIAAPTGLSATVVPTTSTAATPFSLSGVAANAGGLGVGPLAAIAGATYLGGKSAYDMLRGKEDKSIPGYIGRGTLGIATGGLSEVGNYIGKKLGILGHKSTRQSASDHTNYLMDQAGNDQNAQNYVQGMREQFNTAPVGNAFAGGKYATFDEYKKAGLDPKDLSGVYGNMETFGPSEWAGLSQDQREAVTQGLIAANLYKSKKGDIEITDKDQAKQIYSTILAQNQPQTQPAVGAKIYQTLNNKNKKK